MAGQTTQYTSALPRPTIQWTSDALRAAAEEKTGTQAPPKSGLRAASSPAESQAASAPDSLKPSLAAGRVEHQGTSAR